LGKKTSTKKRALKKAQEPAQPPQPIGRPSIFSEELAIKICEEIATSSKSLRTICAQDDFPSVRTVLTWLAEGDKKDGKEEFRQFLHQYTRAREMQADVLADEMIEIADDRKGDEKSFVGINRIHRDKLRIESRKWIASKLKPKKYGDKIDLNHSGEVEVVKQFVIQPASERDKEP
jgi:hypothetical protein